MILMFPGGLNKKESERFLKMLLYRILIVISSMIIITLIQIVGII